MATILIAAKSRTEIESKIIEELAMFFASKGITVILTNGEKESSQKIVSAEYDLVLCNKSSITELNQLFSSLTEDVVCNVLNNISGLAEVGLLFPEEQTASLAGVKEQVATLKEWLSALRRDPENF